VKEPGREPPEWAQRNIRFFAELQAAMDRFNKRLPILFRFTFLIWVVYVMANLYRAFTAPTLLGHVVWTLASAAYLAVAVYFWKSRQPKH
jgi:hypothetical protein